MPNRKIALLIAPVLAAGCVDLPVAPVDQDAAPAFAKGGKPAPPPQAAFTIHDGDVLSDGLGVYRDDECGVVASFNDLDGTPGAQMHLTGLADGCPIARSATLHLLVRHVSDDPHVDDATTPLGTFAITEIKLVLTNNAGVVNAPEPLPGTSASTSCFEVGRNGRKSGKGLRFNAVTYPGSDALVVTALGNGAYRARTAPYPDNIGYCENDDGISYWHVDLDVEVEPTT